MPDWLVIVIGAASGLSTLAGAGALLWRPVRRWGRLARAVEGEPGRPGLMDQMSEMHRKIATIEHQTLPNGGQSLRDSTTRIEQDVAVLKTSNVAQDREIRDIKESISAIRRAYVERRETPRLRETGGQ